MLEKSIEDFVFCTVWFCMERYRVNRYPQCWNSSTSIKGIFEAEVTKNIEIRTIMIGDRSYHLDHSQESLLCTSWKVVQCH